MMKSRWISYLALLLWVSFLYLCGIAFFTRGFLLKRLVVDDRSVCRQRPQDNAYDGCWIEKRFSKALVVIIDALRYDFATYNESLAEKDALPYQNKLPVFSKLMADQPENAKLFRFVADAPTTTMQRIKGLTTGSLPTFIDASSNFGSYEITEDNVIDQMVGNGRRVVLMGDDTWDGLFPKRFHRNYSFPSFNVMDLDTVDEGILRHLVPEMNRGDWDVIVAHFLGVDHCGHLYGPNHEQMAIKLSQMDKAIRSIVQNMDNDTVLFVMGDHGMTRTGDHGGDSENEIHAALFVYSRKRLHSAREINFREIRQTDFTPTLSLLLGIPVPFGNLGTIIREFFVTDNPADDEYFSARALHLNFQQMAEYLRVYMQKSTELPADELHHLNSLHEEATYHWAALHDQDGPDKLYLDHLFKLRAKCEEYIETVGRMCRDRWAQFDGTQMVYGLLMMFAALSINFTLVYNVPKLPASVFVLLGIVPFLGMPWIARAAMQTTYKWGSVDSWILGFIFVIPTVVYSVTAIKNAQGTPRTWWPAIDKAYRAFANMTRKDIATWVIYIMPIFGIFANSYVVSEDSTMAFLVISSMWVLMFLAGDTNTETVARRRTGRHQDEPVRYTKVVYVLAVVVFSVAVRLGLLFRKCREEQWWCEPSDLLRPWAIISTGIATQNNWRYFLSVCSVAGVIMLVRWLLRKAGNLNGFSPAVICMSYCPFVSLVTLVIYWAFQALPVGVKPRLFPNYAVVLPGIIYGNTAIAVAVYFIAPLCVDVVAKRMGDLGPIATSDPKEVLHRVFHHIKLNWQKHVRSPLAERREESVVVFGLATAISAPLIALVCQLLLLLTLLTADGMAGGFFLIVVAMAATLQSLACRKIIAGSGPKGHFDLHWSWIVLWLQLSSVGYFNTGHQFTFTTICWDAAYVGAVENISPTWNIVLKMLFNTFGLPFLFATLLPLLLLWPLSNQMLFPALKKARGKDDKDADSCSPQGEMKILHVESEFQKQLFSLECKYLLLQALKLCAAMVAATWHRRHLMVWKIFAPRFIYEGIQFIVSIPAALLGFCLIARVCYTLDKFIQKHCTAAETR